MVPALDVVGEGVAPGAQRGQAGQAQRPVVERAHRRAWGRPIGSARGERRDARRVDSPDAQRGDDELVARDRLRAAGDVEQTLAPLDREAGEEHRQVGGIRRDAHLVGEHAVELAAVVGAERPAHEVGPPAAEHPRGADRGPRARVLRGFDLAPELRAAVLGERVDGIPLVVGTRRVRRRTRSRSRRARGERPVARPPAPASGRRARSPRTPAPDHVHRRRRWSWRRC